MQIERKGIEIILHFQRFKSICPITGREDQGEIVITYEPGRIEIDIDDLKKYLDLFQNKEILMEDVPINILSFCIKNCISRYRKDAAEKFNLSGIMDAAPRKITVKAIFHKPKKMDITVNFCR